MSRRRRGLSSEERTLWATVARTAVPLRADEAIAPEPALSEPVTEEMLAALPAPDKAVAPAAQKPKTPPLAAIERRTLNRVARGIQGIDGRIDLHGLTQHDAHHRLRAFLVGAQARGAKLVLVITGKGRDGDVTHAAHFGEMERGVLRRRVPQWLAEPGIRDIVIGFEEAHRSHGGGGALYVRIRRRREG
ncbi:DNA-nicking endonuclease, Smr domain [Kaistia soli DSM 19436]|uniref:DNA-nicking endonuclease, Smr domain n=1 Tax=Kaistia soli DSM 19436 TaxID=1122133 RepID=A0A1M5CXQ3_9HYPH|nr:Smr/MutS family protein [Kaistia soli]SHF59282.1 DNA-nicking endonuclease, Smr domain [Kaistia soli DSM 19436]